MTRWILHLIVLLFLLLGRNSIGQTTYSTGQIVGLWKSPKDFVVIHFKFDTNGTVTRHTYGCISSFHFTGLFSVRKDSIIIIYDSLTTTQKIIYNTEASKIANDTLLIINKNKIKVNKYQFIYNQNREEVAFNADSSGILTNKVTDFDDTFIISQFRFNKWAVIDTFSSLDNDYLDIKDFQLPLHYGRNEFKVTVSNEIIKSFSLQSANPIVKLKSKKVIDKIEFSSQTFYELYDSNGKLIISGTADTVDCSKLVAGSYYLNYDTQTTEIKKIIASR